MYVYSIIEHDFYLYLLNVVIHIWEGQGRNYLQQQYKQNYDVYTLLMTYIVIIHIQSTRKGNATLRRGQRGYSVYSLWWSLNLATYLYITILMTCQWHNLNVPLRFSKSNNIIIVSIVAFPFPRMLFVLMIYISLWTFFQLTHSCEIPYSGVELTTTTSTNNWDLIVH